MTLETFLFKFSYAGLEVEFNSKTRILSSYITHKYKRAIFGCCLTYTIFGSSSVFQVLVAATNLIEAARDWWKRVDQNCSLDSPQFEQRTKQCSTELNICLHNVRSVRNKTKDVKCISKLNDINFVVFIASWITNNSDNDFFLKQCCRQRFFFYSVPRKKKRSWNLPFLQMWSPFGKIWKYCL